MNLSTTAVIIASLLAAAGLVYWALSVFRHGDPAMRGLPSSPPAVTTNVQPLMDQLFETRSNCWEVNRWVREDAAPLLQQLASRELSRSEFVRRFALSGADLDKKCPAGAYLEVDGQRRPVAEAVRGLVGVLAQ